MAKTISISDIDHSKIKHLSVDDNCSIMQMINTLLNSHLELKMLKKTELKKAS